VLANAGKASAAFINASYVKKLAPEQAPLFMFGKNASKSAFVNQDEIGVDGVGDAGEGVGAGEDGGAGVEGACGSGVGDGGAGVDGGVDPEHMHNLSALQGHHDCLPLAQGAQ